jgi:hypothetical protein
MSSATTRSSESKTASTSSPAKGELAKECDDIREDFQTLIDDVGSSILAYWKKRPQMAGLMLFAMGFYVGWKVKPW